MTRIFVGRLALTVVLVAMAACGKDKYLLTPEDVESFLHVSAPAQMPADGVSKVEIVATVGTNVAADAKQITFSTSAGTLFGGGASGAKVVVTVDDSTGTARAQLQSEPALKTAHVEITDKSITRSLDVEFVQPAADDVFVLTAAANSLPADGFSRVRITANVKLVGGTPAQRTVTFKASAGTLIGPSGAGSSLDVLPDGSGMASVDLVSDSAPAVAHVTATLVGVVRQIDIPFVGTDVSHTITLGASPGSGVADGRSPVRIIVQINAALPADKRTVRFNATLGTVNPSSIDVNSSNTATVELTSSAIGNARVTATVNGASTDIVVPFARALPDRLAVTVNQPRVEYPNGVTVTVTLLRDVGDVSPQTQVNYDARDAAGNRVGTFVGVTSSSGGVSQATFFPAADTSAGIVTITASVPGAAATGSVQVEVTR